MKGISLGGFKATNTDQEFRGKPNEAQTHASFVGLEGAVCIALLAAVVMAPVKAQAQEGAEGYQIKAAYLYNFLKFVEWPEESFTDPLAPFVIGVVGEDPFGSALPQIVVGKTVQGRDVVIHMFHPGESLRSAHVLFISASEKKRLPAILSSLRGSSVVTVGDTPGFLETGGVIQFLLENDRIRFAINVDATRVAGVKVSSKLLSLAKIVGGNGKEGGN